MTVEQHFIALFNAISQDQFTNPGAARAKGKLVATAIEFGLPKLAELMRRNAAPGAKIASTEAEQTVQRPRFAPLAIPGEKKKEPAPLTPMSGDSNLAADNEAPEAEAGEPEEQEGVSELTAEMFQEIDPETLGEQFGPEALRSFAEEHGIKVASDWKNPGKIAAFIRDQLNKPL